MITPVRGNKNSLSQDVVGIRFYGDTAVVILRFTTKVAPGADGKFVTTATATALEVAKIAGLTFRDLRRTSLIRLQAVGSTNNGETFDAYVFAPICILNELIKPETQ